MSDRVELRVLTAQRDEALAENERLRKAGNYLYAALNFYGPRPGCRDRPFYADAVAALATWEAATEEHNHA